MKKISAILLALPLLYPAVASAQINLCPSSFSQLCGNADSFGPVLGQIVSFIFVIAIILALAFLIYGGIKWLVSSGDKGKVEEARGTIIAAIIGLIIVFLSYVILTFVLNLFGVNINALTIPKINLTGGAISSPTDVSSQACTKTDGVAGTFSCTSVSTNPVSYNCICQ